MGPATEKSDLDTMRIKTPNEFKGRSTLMYYSANSYKASKDSN
jgi:hypothetical protein